MRLNIHDTVQKLLTNIHTTAIEVMAYCLHNNHTWEPFEDYVIAAIDQACGNVRICSIFYSAILRTLNGASWHSLNFTPDVFLET